MIAGKFLEGFQANMILRIQITIIPEILSKIATLLLYSTWYLPLKRTSLWFLSGLRFGRSSSLIIEQWLKLTPAYWWGVQDLNRLEIDARNEDRCYCLTWRDFSIIYRKRDSIHPTKYFRQSLASMFPNSSVPKLFNRKQRLKSYADGSITWTDPCANILIWEHII